MVNHSDFTGFAAKMAEEEKKMRKVLNIQMDKLSSVIKQFEVKKEKKGKVNKKSATMMLGQDSSVKIVFDDPNDGVKFFEGIK